MSTIASEISRLSTLRNNIRTKLIALGIISDSSADLEDCYDGINAVAKRTSSDMSVNGATVSVPAGYYATTQTKSVASGSATTPTTTITANPTISVGSDGLITASNSKSENITPTVSAGYVSSGTAGSVTVDGSNTEQLSTIGATTYHPSSSDQTIASGKYLTGAQTIKAVTTTNLTAANIVSGVTVKIGDSTDDDCVASVTGTASGGGGGGSGSSWKFLASAEFTVNTTSTSNTSVGDINLDLSDYENVNTIVWVHIRDKAGKRAGYLYGSDTIFFHWQYANNNSNSLAIRPLISFSIDADGNYVGSTSAYGVFAYRLAYTAHYVQIYSRYSSSTTRTINGTFKCDVYVLTPPSGMTIFP